MKQYVLWGKEYASEDEWIDVEIVIGSKAKCNEVLSNIIDDDQYIDLCIEEYVDLDRLASQIQ